jgi:hypothetical protein
MANIQNRVNRKLENQEIQYAYLEGKHFKLDFEKDGKNLIEIWLTTKLLNNETEYVSNFLRGFNEN